MKLIQITLLVIILFTFYQCKKDDDCSPSQTVVVNGLIAIAEWDSSMKSHIFTITPDGKNKIQLTFGSSEFWMPVWSPDGKKIAYVSKNYSGINMNIYVMNADGSNQHQLTFDGVNMTPCWSPDGLKIAYAHQNNGGVGLNIWVMNADGTGQSALITSLNAHDNAPSWSPNGKKIAFTSNQNGGHYQIWAINLSDTMLSQLTTAYYDTAHSYWIEQKVPAYSPDGKYIAYWEGLEGSNSTTNTPWTIKRMNADGTNKKFLAQGDDPSWSPDSKTIIHPWQTNCPSSVSIGGVSPDGTNERLLFMTNCGFGRASWK